MPRFVTLPNYMRDLNLVTPGKIQKRRRESDHFGTVQSPAKFSTLQLILCSVSSVEPDKVIYTIRDSDGNIKKHEIRSNFTLWSTGIAMNPFTEKVTTYLPNQVHKKAIEVDAYLRVKGAPRGELYAVGDCATVRLIPASTQKKKAY